jgi:hypothetical protein
MPIDALGWTLRGRNLPAGDSIGRQVAILRKLQKLSQRSLAAMSGLTHPTVVALEVRNTGLLSYDPLKNRAFFRQASYKYRNVRNGNADSSYIFPQVQVHQG